MLTDGTLLIVAIISFAGSFLQTNIGFGFPVIAMIFLPVILPFQTAVAITQLIALAGVSFLSLKYFKDIDWKTLTPLLGASLLVTGLITTFSFNFSPDWLTADLLLL